VNGLDQTNVIKFDLNYKMSAFIFFFIKDKLTNDEINTKFLGLETAKRTNWENHSLRKLPKIKQCTLGNLMYISF